MRVNNETLAVSVVVRRVRIGAAPFGWEVHHAAAAKPLHVSPETFRSMEATYRVDQARLAEFVPQRRVRHTGHSKRLKLRPAAMHPPGFPKSERAGRP
jgi:hypothetical protein